MLPLRSFQNPHFQGLFGAIRKHDIHTGIDLYCEEGDFVFAIEDGIVVNVCNFTGVKANLPWWNDTQAVLVEGKSGVFLYGEIESNVEIGNIILEGDCLGRVLTVLKKDKGLPMTMLHLELYEHGYKGNGEIWNLGSEKPKMLKDVSYVIQ